jgi:ABC-type multidrug transport system ATPase subunit
MYCLETDQLTHTFSGTTVLNNIHLQVPEGSIYGFLGPNGAGKTTTLRLLLGLLKKKQGAISIFGVPFHRNRVSILKRVGSLIETPSLYGHLTAVENLQLLRKIYQCPKQRVREVLELVGLPDTGKKKASQFSLGMRQRLGIAVALLNSPSLLILDEPTNGLDPNGIIEMRELLRRLNQEQGITILLSSHLLSEIEKLVTHVGIINKGELLFQGTLEALLHQQRTGSVIVLETSDPARALELLQKDGVDTLMGDERDVRRRDGLDDHAEEGLTDRLENGLNARIENGRIILPVVPKERIAGINRQLVRGGIDVYNISHLKNDLEAIFIDLIKN